jgi:hypothetical protein
MLAKTALASRPEGTSYGKQSRVGFGNLWGTFGRASLAEMLAASRTAFSERI